MINSPPTDVICPVCGSGHVAWKPRETPPLHCGECTYAFGEDEAGSQETPELFRSPSGGWVYRGHLIEKTVAPQPYAFVPETGGKQRYASSLCEAIEEINELRKEDT